MSPKKDAGFRRSRNLRRLLLVALAVVALGLIHLRSESERAKAEELCVDGVTEFDSGVTGSTITCR